MNISRFIFIIILSSCNFSNQISLNVKDQCVEVKQGSKLIKFSIETSEGIYYFRLKKGIQSGKNFCFNDFEYRYVVDDIYPKHLNRRFRLPLNDSITFSNNSYSDMTSFEITLLIDSLGKVKEKKR